MHSSYPHLRRECSMNVRKQFPPAPISPEVRAEIDRILQLWAQARARHGDGGPYLFGTFSAADIMFAPVVTRFVTYSIPVPRFAATYMEAMLDHPWMREWIEAAQEEPWVIEQYEKPAA
jgi:glutathione S-transferase